MIEIQIFSVSNQFTDDSAVLISAAVNHLNVIPSIPKIALQMFGTLDTIGLFAFRRIDPEKSNASFFSFVILDINSIPVGNTSNAGMQCLKPVFMSLFNVRPIVLSFGPGMRIANIWR